MIISQIFATLCILSGTTSIIAAAFGSTNPLAHNLADKIGIGSLFGCFVTLVCMLLALIWGF